MLSSKLPEPDCDVAAFIRDLENRLKADEEKYMCNVCYEPFANVKLNCPHFLCPTCYDKLDTCPMCRKQFKTDTLVFSNFDACVFRRCVAPHNYDILIKGGKMRQSSLLYCNIMLASLENDLMYEQSCYPWEGRGGCFLSWDDVEAAVKIIKKHTKWVNRVTNDPIRKEMVARGWLRKDEGEGEG